MDIVGLFLIFGLSLFVFQFRSLGASYQCGIRKHSFVPLLHGSWESEEGQWPWHVAVFHKNASDFPEYVCGGTLIDEKHILTAAHCAVIRDTSNPLPAASIELHFGKHNLSKIASYTQIRDVSEVHVHPKYSKHRNDVAVLVTRLPVNYTDFVIPICMDQRADKDVRNLEDKRGWITGWGTTQIGVISDVLRTASMPVVSYLQCFRHEKNLFGNILNEDVFCAGDLNGTSPDRGDSGGGMYFSEGDRWVLKGIASFAKTNEMKAQIDTSKFAVFANVQGFLAWIKEIVNESKLEAVGGPKRISEQECDRFRGLAEKNADGTCANYRRPHTVSITSYGIPWCNGALINEFHVLTSCRCLGTLIYLEYKIIKEKLRVYVETKLYDLGSVTLSRCYPYTSFGTNDLAVMTLSPPISLSSSLIPACLASKSTENLYDTLLQTGIQVDRNDVKQYLDSEEIKIINHEECDERSGRLCVIHTNRSRDGYQPLTGSLLQSVNSRTCMYTIVGLSADYQDFLDVNITAPHKYTRISHYLDWIEELVWNTKPPIDQH